MKIKLKRKYSLRAFLYLIPLSFGIFAIGNFIAVMLPDIGGSKVSEELIEMINDGKMMNAIITAGLLSPIIEELFFRLLLYYLIKRFFNDKVAIIGTAIAFAVAHMNLRQGVYALFAGLVLGYVRYSYNSIFCTIFMHVLMNVFSIIFIKNFMEFKTLPEMLFMLLISFTIFTLSFYRIINIMKEGKLENEVH